MTQTRIDPQQLLRCLGVLLGPSGGIKSASEIKRIASLMSKFSKKLVSRCIYIQILQNTTSDLLVQFMADGGWDLVFQWLDDAISRDNFPLIREILELLLVFPINLERLKENNCPKIIKKLSKDSEDEEVRNLANQLVENWLEFIKSGQASVSQYLPSPSGGSAEGIEYQQEADQENQVDGGNVNHEVKFKLPRKVKQELVEKKEYSDSSESDHDNNGPLPLFKITVRNGKNKIYKIKPKIAQVSKTDQLQTSKVITESQQNFKDTLQKIISAKLNAKPGEAVNKKVESVGDNDKHVKQHKDKVKDKSSTLSSTKDKSSKHKQLTDTKTSSSSKDKHSSSHKSHSSSSSTSSSKDKDKGRDRNKLKDKHKEKLSSSSSSNPSKLLTPSEVQANKDKDTLERLKLPAINTLGKIPKKSSATLASTTTSSSNNNSSSDLKKSATSSTNKSSSNSSDSDSKKIDLKRPKERPKTVKTFNSKFRSTGLEEEIKPPPSRANVVTKKPSSSSASSGEKKVPSVAKKEEPPEKKQKLIEMLETKKEKPLDKPGGVKLIPPKPKPMLQESDMFSDALTASTKTEPRKRKRRTSGSKDGASESKKTEPVSPSVVTSPSDVKPSFKFYRDTLEDEEKKKADVEDACAKNEESVASTDDSASVQTENTEDSTSTTSVIPGGRLYPNGVLLHGKSKIKKSVRWKTESDLISIKYFDLDETERVNVTRTFVDMKQMERHNEREAFMLARKQSSDTMEEKTSWQVLVRIDLPEGTQVVEAGKSSREKSVQYAREKTVLQAVYFKSYAIPDSPAEPDPESHPTTDPKVIPLDDITGNKDSVASFTHLPWPESKPSLIPSSPPPQQQQQQQQMQLQMQQNQPQMFGAGFGFPPMAMMQGPAGNWRAPDGSDMSMNFPNNPMGGMFPMQGPPPDGFGPMSGFNPGFPMGGDPSMFGPGPMGGQGGGGGGGPPPMWNRNWQGQGPPPPGPFNLPKGVCRNFARFGSCKRGNSCRFMHPGVNCPPLS